MKQQSKLDADSHRVAVTSSALWAAAGDALGWVSELADEKDLARRRKGRNLDHTFSWRRKVYSRGPSVDLPAGCYSDDTQLRLSVARATTGNGQFDAEVFAKVELPVWLAYSLGAGRGTTAAASNLAKPSVTWFTNFFRTQTGGYFSAGGNGAAMRVQPHVWRCPINQHPAYLTDVIKDSLITHGHPHGFCGAIFHSMCLGFALSEEAVPSPNYWKSAVHEFLAVYETIKNDRSLRNVWLPAWEEEKKESLEAVLHNVVEETLAVLRGLENIEELNPVTAYKQVIEILDLRNPKCRGSGLLTAIAASALAWLFRAEPCEVALITAANQLGTDTDSIASMAGAILGAANPEHVPGWEIQDKKYIEAEAQRMSAIAFSQRATSFGYPDLMQWKAPSTQADAVVNSNERMLLKGLGRITPTSTEIVQGEFLWQWCELPFGQTVLVKRRVSGLQVATSYDDPKGYNSREAEEKNVTSVNKPVVQKQPKLPFEETPQKAVSFSREISTGRSELMMDDLTQRVISSGFEPQKIGEAFLTVVRKNGRIEDAVAFSAIIAKAIVRRDKK